MAYEEEIRFFALENALKFNGKANPGAVIGKILALHPEAKDDMKTLSANVQQSVKDINSMLPEAQKQEFEAGPKITKPEREERKSLPDLPGAEIGKVVTRIPPEPSKYNHIGHALSFIINYTYAKRYEGKCIMRFEDTNPEKSSQEFVDSMKEDLFEYLELKPDSVHYVSDDMPKFYELAEKLINMKKAYVCSCDRDKMQELREKGECCTCNTREDVSHNLFEWKAMLEGRFEPGERILRLAGDMKSKNHVMRDPVIFRINKTPHYRQKKKYFVWPLYDFENSVEDSLNGVTHILRSSEFGEMRIELQDYIKNLLSLPKQHVIQYGRFNIKGATTKGREIREAIEKGEVTGWDDPSLVTLKAMKRRGIVKETFYKLIEEVGISKNTAKNLDWTMIASINRSILDSKVNRYFFIENPVEIYVKGSPEIHAELKLHPDHPERGTRKFMTNGKFYISSTDLKNFKEGHLVRLMDCLNFSVLPEKKYDFHSTGHDEYKGRGNSIIHWLPKDAKNASVEIRMPDNSIVKGIAEESVNSLEEGDIVQFTRFGFCRLDKKLEDKLSFWFTNK